MNVIIEIDMGDITFLTIFYDLFFSLKDKVKKLTVEREALESHLKNEKDEKELYKVKYWQFELISCIYLI